MKVGIRVLRWYGDWRYLIDWVFLAFSLVQVGWGETS